MTQLWNLLEGVSVGGKYELRRCLAGDESGAFFLTSIGPDARRAVLKLIPEESATAERQLTLWRRVAGLSHPNLLALLDCGRAGVIAGSAGASFLYAVFEYPDDTLSPAVAAGSLAAGEKRDVTNAALAALRYVHGQGLVHAAVDPAHVVAVGDCIKLASDTLREPGPGATAEDDLRAVETLFLEPAGQPVPASAAPKPRLQRQPVSLPAFPKWIYAGLALPVLAILALTHRSTSSAPTPGAVVAPAPAPAVSADRAAKTPPNARVRERKPWRVVAYVCPGLKDAELKARHINEKWPAYHAEVYCPKGRNRPPYMVVLGGKMARREAVRLMKKARAAGLSRGTFVHEYDD